MADRPALPRGAAVIVALVILLPGLLHANGGTLRFLGILDPWEVAVFTDPSPPRPDSLDVSVLVTLPGSPRPVDGLTVEVTVESAHHGVPMMRRATKDEADDPRYYAAKFRDLGTDEVTVTVTVRGPEGGGGTASFVLEPREPGFLDHPAVLFLLALLPLALVGWWLRRAGGGNGTRTAGPPDD